MLKERKLNQSFCIRTYSFFQFVRTNRKLIQGQNTSIFLWCLLALSCFGAMINFLTAFSLPKTSFFNNTTDTGLTVKTQILQNKIQVFTTLSSCSVGTGVAQSGYITVYPYKGRLGNQVFQLASLIGISKTTNLTSFLCDDNNNNKFLPREVFELSNLNNKPCNTGLDSFSIYRESAHAKYKKVNIDSLKNWTLDGYFQSFRYFSAYTDLIRETLRIKKTFLDQAKGFLEKRVPINSVVVGIHVRRRDFITKTQEKLGRIAPDIGYITQAKAKFQRQYGNVTFIVITDDKQWCRANILDEGVFLSPFVHEGFDLALSQLCDHMIITVGTFGWWAGWLSSGQVIYYSKYPRPGSQIDIEFSKADYYPQTWLPFP